MLKYGFVAAVKVAVTMVIGAIAILPIRGPVAQEKGLAAGHPRVVNPANLSGARAESVYQAIRDAMRRQYGHSSDPVTLAYQGWRRYTTAPYRSAVHGERFLNNYANNVAKRYELYEKVGQMPPGAIIAKDSFTVTAGGVVATGPLFLMEKKPKGFDPKTGDWLYMMIRPDGTPLGDAWDRNTDSVAFCAKCHNTAPPGQDHLFFMPKEVRIQTGK
jgi:hypothetical protein